MLKRPEGELVPETLIGALYEPLTADEGFVTVTLAVLELFGLLDTLAVNVGCTEAALGEIVSPIVTLVSPEDMLKMEGLRVSVMTLPPPLP